MIEEAKLNTGYRDLTEFLVWILTMKVVLAECSECPRSEALLEVLMNEFDNLPKEIALKQWVKQIEQNL